MKKITAFFLMIAIVFSFVGCTPKGAIKYEKFTEYAIKVGYNEDKMDGKLTIPKSVKKPPVIILVQGSGQTDMDETIGGAGNKPFKDIAHGLAEQGIATIRYDKRFYTFEDKKYEMANSVTIQDEVLNDVGAAIKLALADKRLNSNKIYILGHSLGGMMAPKIATDYPAVAGIISMGGTLRKTEDIIYTQKQNELAKREDLDETQKQEELESTKAEVDKVKSVVSEDGESAFGQPASYWYSLNQIDGVDLVKKLTMPILVLQGGKDFQMDPSVEYRLWCETLNGRENFSSHEYPDLNHLMMKSNGLSDAGDYDFEGHVEQVVIDDITKWVQAN